MTEAAAGAPRPANPLLVGWGNVLFKLRDGLFPAVLVLLVFLSRPQWPGGSQSADDLLDLVGVLVALAGQVLRAAVVGTVYIIRGGKDRKVYAEGLVTGGFFAHCRNPLYVGNILILLGLFTIWNGVLAWAVGVPFFLVGYVAIVAAEESFLRGKFGAEFDAYCARVPRFVPRLQGLGETFSSMDFRWRRVVVKEYGTPTAWVLVWCAIVAWNLTRHGQAALRPWALPMLEIVAILAVVGWATARLLKKTGRVVAD